MKNGMDIRDLASELKRQVANKKDYTARQSGLRVELMKEPVDEVAELVADTPPGGNALDELLSKVDLTKTYEEPEQEPNGRPLVPQLVMDGIGQFPIGDIAHRQIASHLKIPKTYYDRLLDSDPEETRDRRHALLTNNINTWLDIRGDDQRMVRTMDGKARAYVSNAYRRIDNYDLMMAVLQTAIDMDCKVASCNVTDSYLYLKLITERLQGEVKVGDIVQAGLVVKNSEVGLSSVVVEPMIIRLSCMNGAVMMTAIRKRHVGSRSQLGDKDVEELLTDATKKLDDQAFFSKVQDVVKGSLTEDLFNMNLDKLKGTATRNMSSDAKPVVEELGKRMSFSETETEGVLQSYIKTIEDTGATQWGLGNAVTLMSHGVKSYDRASELEKAGGQVFNLDDAGWADLMATAS